MLTPIFPDAFSQEVSGLGTPIRYFPIRKLNRLGSLVAAIIFFAGALVSFLYGLYSAYNAYMQHGLAVVDDHLTGPLIWALVFFVVGVFGAWSAYISWNKGILLYERGFAVRSRSGIQVWSWINIATVLASITRHYTNGIYTGTTHVYTITNKQNERVMLNDAFSKVEDLGNAIQESVFPLLYEPAAQQYNSGQPVLFGPIQISKDGLCLGKNTIPWAEMKDVTLKQGQLKISKKNGGWFSGKSMPVSNIPNLRVLLTLIHQVIGLKTP